MTAIKRAREIAELAESLKDQEQTRQEFDALSERYQALNAAVSGVRAAWEAAQEYEEYASVETPSHVIVERVIGEANEMVTRFKTDKTIAALIGKQRWVRMREDIGELEAQIRKSVASAWARFRDQYSREPAERVEQRLPPTPENKKALTEYRRTAEELSRLLSVRPDASAALKEAVTRAKRLDQVMSRMNFKVSPEVANFLKMASAQGVPLSAYTAAVKVWLEENEMLDKYVVRSKL